MKETDPHDARSLLHRLTRRLTAALAPMAGDGWICRRVLPRVDGTAAVEILGPGLEATFNWVDPLLEARAERRQSATGKGSWSRPTTVETAWSWGALLPPDDLPDGPLLRQVGRLLSAALAHAMGHSHMSMLRYCNRKVTRLGFDDGVVDLLLADRFGPGHTRWFDHTFQGASQHRAESFELTFTGPHGSLLLGVALPGLHLEGELVLAHRLFGLWLLSDPRPPAARRHVRAQVERFVGFLLCRGTHPGMTLLHGHSSAGPTVDVPPGGEATSWRGAPISTSRWGNPLQWMQTFSDFEIARSGLCNVRFEEPVAHVLHGERECCMVEPRIRPRAHVYARLPFPPALPDRKSAGSQGRLFVSLITERETVLGGDDSLATTLQAAAEDQHTRLIHINNTCLPKMVGDDLDSHVARLSELTDKPILNLNTDLDSPAASFGHMLAQAQRQASAHLDPPPLLESSVSLLGYPPGIHRNELIDCLKTIDVRVATFLLPELDVERAWRYRSGGAQVVYPQRAWQELHSDLFSDLDTPLLDTPAPFGLRDTARWLETIADALGKTDLFQERWPALVATTRERFDALTARVRDRHLRVGAVVTPSTVHRLHQPEDLYGARLFPLLEELGFGLDLLLLSDPDELASGPAPDEQSALAALRASLENPAELAVFPFSSPEDLAKVLTAAPCELVYSEVACDQRLSRAGKTGFGLDLLEMGPAGALRSLARLVHAATWPFYRRYHPFLPSRQELDQTRKQDASRASEQDETPAPQPSTPDTER